jgi:hypothetical protein
LALGDRPYLVVAASLLEQQALTLAEQALVAAWLRQQVCPVLAVAPVEERSPLADACDVVVADPEELAPVIAGIRQAPLAAGILVQVLRATAGLDVERGLLVESLAYATLQAGPEFRRWLAGHSPARPAVPQSQPLLVDRTGDTLAIILNQPERRNAISVTVRDALIEALQLVLSDASIRRVRLSGRGDCFSVGGDLDEFGTTPDPATGHVVRSIQLPAQLLARCADRVECHVHSACIGAGIELPAFARSLIATPDAFFQLPELRFGLIPGAGGCVSMPRRIGRQRTAWLVLSGRRVTARTALHWGLVDEISGS